MKHLLTGAVALFAAFAATPSFATAPVTPVNYTFTLSGSGFNGNGTITVDPSKTYSNLYACTGCATGDGYLVTNVTGTLNGASITGVAPVNSTVFNNNMFYPNSPVVLDFGDLGFTVGGVSYNLFEGTRGGHPGYFLTAPGLGYYTIPVSFSIVAANAGAVPEPATWGLMILGFGMVGAALRRRQAVRRGAMQHA